MIVYNYDADLEVSDTCVRSSLLSWVELSFLNWLADYLHVVPYFFLVDSAQISTDKTPVYFIHFLGMKKSVSSRKDTGFIILVGAIEQTFSYIFIRI